MAVPNFSDPLRAFPIGSDPLLESVPKLRENVRVSSIHVKFSSTFYASKRSLLQLWERERDPISLSLSPSNV